MLSFLRARSMRSSPSADLAWSGRELTLRLDRGRDIERVALDFGAVDEPEAASARACG